MQKLLTFAKGNLTVASITAYLVSGQLAAHFKFVEEIPQAFESGAGTGTLLDAVFGIGALWGIIRKGTEAYKKTR